MWTKMGKGLYFLLGVGYNGNWKLDIGCEGVENPRNLKLLMIIIQPQRSQRIQRTQRYQCFISDYPLPRGLQNCRRDAPIPRIKECRKLRKSRFYF